MPRTTTILYALLTVLTLGVAGARPARPLLLAGIHAPLHAARTASPLGQGTQPALNVYPNPARGLTTIQVSGSPGFEYQVRVSNVLGSEVRRFTLRPELQPAEGTTIDLNGVPPGLYFCSLLAGDKTLATKRLTVL